MHDKVGSYKNLTLFTNMKDKRTKSTYRGTILKKIHQLCKNLDLTA